MGRAFPIGAEMAYLTDEQLSVARRMARQTAKRESQLWRNLRFLRFDVDMDYENDVVTHVIVTMTDAPSPDYTVATIARIPMAVINKEVGE